MKKLPKWSKTFLMWAIIVAALIPLSPFRALIACHLFQVTHHNDEFNGAPPLWVDGCGDIPVSAGEALAIAYSKGDETHGRSYWEMIRRYPDCPALYAAVLQHAIRDSSAPAFYKRHGMVFSDEAERLHRLKPPPMRLADAPELRRLDEAVSAAKRLEPRNAFFDLFEAYLCYGKGRDRDAVACIHRASLKTGYDSHSSELALAYAQHGVRLAFPLNFLIPLGRMQAAMSMPQGYLTSLRSFTRSIVGGMASDPRRRRDAVVLASDVVRLGGTMSARSHSLLEFLVGASVQGAATHSLYLGLTGRRPTGDAKRSLERRVSAIRAVAGSELPDREWNLMRQSVDQTEGLMPWSRAYSRRIVTWSDLDAVLRSMFMLSIASRLLKSLVVLLIVWALVRLLLRLRRRTDAQPVGPSPVILWLAIAVASTPVRRPDSLLLPAMRWVGWWLPVAVGVATAAVVMCLLIPILRLRIREDIGRFDTYLLRVRRACAYCIPGVLGLYALTMLLTIPIASRANHQVDRWIAGEMSIVRAEKPIFQDFAGPGTPWPDPTFPTHLPGLRRL